MCTPYSRSTRFVITRVFWCSPARVQSLAMTTLDANPEQHLLIQSIASALDAEYGRKPWHSHGDPLSELIGTILSQHTSDSNTAAAYASLRQRFPTWPEVLTAPVNDVADAIRTGGLANIKAARIQDALHFVDGSIGNNWDAFRGLSVETARRQLCQIPGVGPKTASCVILFSLGMPAMPVDTHVHRVALRTGMIPTGTSADQAHGILEVGLDGTRDDSYSFHMNLIEHGRQVCKARSPRCGACPISYHCHFFRTASPFESDTASIPGE